MKRITRQVAFSGLSKEESYRFALQLIAKARSENESIRIDIVTGKAAPPDPVLVLDMPGGSSVIRIPYRRIISISSLYLHPLHRRHSEKIPLCFPVCHGTDLQRKMSRF